MNFWQKIQKQPESIRKVILWIVVIIVGSGLLFLWTKSVQRKLKSFPGEEFKKQLQPPLPKEELKNLPQFEMPEINEEELKKMEEELKKLEEEEASSGEE